MFKGASNITFILFTYNEERRIEYAVRNLAPYGEVFLLDGGSTDKTREVSEKFGAHFVLRPERTSAYVETLENFNFVKSLVKTDWIFWGYVDNFLPKTLLEKLTELSHQDRYKYVYVPIYTYLWGDIKHSIIKASYSCFFRKDKADFSKNQIHGMGKFVGLKEEILHLPNKLEYAIRHFSLYDVTKFVNGHVRYAGAEAQQKFDGGKRFSVTYLLGSMARYFYLFYKRGWRAGARGLYIALLYSFFRLMVAVRLYELEHNLTLESIEAAFAKEKKKIVEEIEQNIAGND